METNLSIENCSYNNDQYCARKPFLCGGTPCNKYLKANERVTFLNLNAMTGVLANDLHQVATPIGRGYTSEDSRLKNPRTGNIALVLDRPPTDQSVDTDNVANFKNCDKFKTGFSQYKDLQGQIVYYVDNELATPFPSPVFENQAQVTGYNFVTPMNGIEPRYERKPVRCRNCLQIRCRCDYLGGLSWIDDSNEHREDLIALQMGRVNKTQWAPRWGSKSI